MLRLVRHCLYFLVLLGFLSLCFAPFIQALRVPDNEVTTLENRPVHQRPVLPETLEGWVNYPKAFERYWNDHAGFRIDLVRLRNQARRHLGIGARGQVLIGKDGWLFSDSHYLVDNYRNADPLTEQDLKRWQAYLERRHKMALRRGAQYLFVIAPNKHNIYPEKLPYHIRKIGVHSQAEQLSAYMAKHNPDIDILDLRPVLLQAKDKARTYNPKDTHWNMIGAYYAYRAITQALDATPPLQPAFHTPQDFYPAFREEFGRFDIPYYNGLERMLGMGKSAQPQPLLKNLEERCADNAPLPLHRRWAKQSKRRLQFRYNATTCKEGEHRALIIRDSFSELMKPFFSEQFHYVAYIIQPPLAFFSYKYFMDTVHPDFVIEEIVEGSLWKARRELTRKTF